MKNSLSEQVSGFSEKVLQSVIEAMTGIPEVKLYEWTTENLGKGSGNFVTGGVYRIAGALYKNDVPASWSVIVKITKPDTNRNDRSHYNHWRREISVYESDIHSNLPAGVEAPTCYAVEQKPDGSIWLWLEDFKLPKDTVQPIFPPVTSLKIASTLLGKFHAPYLIGEKALPDNPCLNKGWLKSWIHESRKYAPWPYEGLSVLLDGYWEVQDIVLQFQEVEQEFESLVYALDNLPRTLSHQDFYRRNYFIKGSREEECSLRLIDWQFTSLSGIGEDLGRFYGLSMTYQDIPDLDDNDHRFLFLDSYLSGLSSSGWDGKIKHAEYGFLVACAVRSLWEVPKLIRLIATLQSAEESKAAALESDIRHLSHITKIQLEMAQQAIGLQRDLNF